MDISSMSGVLSNDAYKNQFGNPDSNAQGAIVAAMPAGSFVGALAVSKLADVIGRKWTVIVSGWIWVIGSILQCAAVVSLEFPPFRVFAVLWICASWLATGRLDASRGFRPRRDRAR